MNIIVVILASMFGLLAQSPAFEVASVKAQGPFVLGSSRVSFACHGTDGPASATVPVGRCVGTSIELSRMIDYVYDLEVRPGHLVGAEDFASAERYAIEAKSDPPATQQQLKLMMQELLADRFKLKFHRETKDVDGFALVVAGGGIRMKTPSGDEDKPGLVVKMAMDEGSHSLMQTAVGTNTTLADLISVLSSKVGRPVVDKTGLTGKYNYSLPMGPLTRSGTESTGPSIFTLVQENLGLKLVSEKVPLNVFVIDHAEKPAP